MRTRLTVALILALVFLLPVASQAAPAQTALPPPWDTAWNAPGMAVPLAVDADPAWVAQRDQSCCALLGARPPETDEDAQVVAAGWLLTGSYTSGWGITVVHAAVASAGMGRPADNQAFVFVNGVFAGTVAPFLTGPDNGPPIVQILGSDSLYGTFRYWASPDEPFCCPSGVTTVEYDIDDSSGMPVLVVQSAANSTQAN